MIRQLFTVFHKELVDVLRDRRTLFFMLALPTLTIPLLMWILTQTIGHFLEKIARSQMNVLIVNPEAAPQVVSELEQRANPLSLGLKLMKMLSDRGIQLRDLTLAQQNPESFLRLLQKRGVDQEALTREVRAILGEPDFDPLPGNLLSRAYPPNFRFLKALPARSAALADARRREGALSEAVRANEIALALEFSEDASQRLGGRDGTEVVVYYLEASDRSLAARSSLKGLLEAVGKGIVVRRLEDGGLPAGFASPITVRAKQLPGPGKFIKFLSQILPYMILIFSFLGALYPAIDLGAGEKERGTLETLLVAPVSRLALVLGKFLVVLCAALVSAFLSTVSLALSLRFSAFSVLAEISGQAFSFNGAEAFAALLLVLPTACIFSALLLALSIFAKSFKEGQSYASPLQILVLLPAFASFIPGVELDWVTSSIPVVNVSLALREIFTGNLELHWAHLGMIFLSTSVLAGGLLGFATWWFQREQVLFRT